MHEPFSLESDVFTYQRRVLRVLLLWAAGSVAAGLRGWRGSHPFWQGVGMQCAGWGAIDALIAFAGLHGARRKGSALAQGTLTDVHHADEARKFERILWINAGLDVGYALGGLLFVQRNEAHAQRRGMGAGVIAQALFLLIFDVCNGVIVRSRRATTDNHLAHHVCDK